MRSTPIKLYIFAFFLAVASCKPQREMESEPASAASPLMSTRDFFDPSRKAWTGRLILPKSSERRPDGGVWFEVYEGTPGKTFAKPIWLTWNKNSKWFQEYDSRTKVDIKMSQADLQHARSAKNFVPERLSGLSQVSFLESLAGSRPEGLKDTIRGTATADSLEVFIEKASLSGETLTLDSEPVQITGKTVALLQFKSKVGDLAYSALAWHQGGFSKELKVSYQKPRKNPSESASQPTLEGIEKSSANFSGWYAFGDLRGDSLEIRALEPRAAMVLDKASAYPDGEQYIDVDNFKDTAQSKGRIFTTIISKNSKKTSPPVGVRGLAVHIFGSIGGKGGDAPVTIPAIGKKYYTGHFAFGVGEVVRDPITGQNKLDLEYRQIYGNGPDGIVSGAIKWHVYSGSLERGWMYSRPISDAVIWNPSLVYPYKIGTTTLDPMTEILQELDVMGARFRSGDGKGVAAVTATKSCVQDSNQATFIPMARFLEWQKNSPEAKSGIENLDPENAKRFQNLVTIASLYRDKVIGPAGGRTDWKEARDSKKNPILAKDISNLRMVWDAIRSLGVLTPNGAYEKILEIFYEQNSLIWFVRTNQVGGNKPDIFPIAPGFD